MTLIGNHLLKESKEMPEKYFDHKESLIVIKNYKEKKINILGIERIILEQDGSFSPDITGIADIPESNVEDAYDSAFSFLLEYGLNQKERFIITV